MKEYTIALKLTAPNKELASEVADKAQILIDKYGGDTFLKAVDFMDKHPDMLSIALGMIGVNKQ